jgi:N-acetylglucosamine-6-phosphate deacetylase
MSLLALAARKIFTPLEVIEDGLLVIEDQSIRAVGSQREISVPEGARFVNLGERILAPGFVEIHIHGARGRDVMEGSAEALSTVARELGRHGTTSFLPTTLTAPVATLMKSLEGLGSLIRSWHAGGYADGEPAAEPLGIHMEGPFLSAARRGVHPAEHLLKPSPELFERLAKAAQGAVRVLTLAPELEESLELASLALRNGVKVALGHSDATFEETQKAITAGATHAVHTFNAMRPFAHRECGILGAVLTDDRLLAEVIADGVHVSAPALRLLLRAKGATHIILVTDGTSATGMGEGRYRLGEIDILVEKDTPTGALVCRNAEGKLAGSVLTQDRAVRNMAAFTGASLREAVTMATWNPARLLGVENRKGCLRPGADADVVVLEPDGTVAGVMARGHGNIGVN